MTDKKNGTGDKIYLAGISVTFLNDGDCTDPEPQEIVFKTENNGVGNFVVIETERWSASDVDALVAMVRKFASIASDFLGESLKEEELL